MENDDHIARLKKSVADWNAWRIENPNIRPDLSGADLIRTNLSGANLSEARLGRANLSGADLREANLSRADLEGASLVKVQLEKANLSEADLCQANLSEASLGRANLTVADLGRANLSGANLREASLVHADLGRANLSGANLSEASLRTANLEVAVLINTDFTGADLTGCRIYGVSAWGLKLGGSNQQSLVITPSEGMEYENLPIAARGSWGGRPISVEPEITVDNIEVAQFIHLILNNQKVRDVIDTVTSKAVLILGRFTDERKTVLDALRDELRKRNYLPILFDFEVPARRNVTETVTPHGPFYYCRPD